MPDIPTPDDIAAGIPEDPDGEYGEPQGMTVDRAAGVEAKANLIDVKKEIVDEINEHGISWVAYFKGTPSQEDFQTLYERLADMVDPLEPQQVQDEVSNAAGLERWTVGFSV